MPVKRDHTSLKVAFIVTVFTAFVFLFLFLYIGINSRKYAYEDSKRLASEVSRKAVLETEIYLNNAVSVARSLKEKSLLLRKAKVNRSILSEIIKDALIENPNFLAVWTMWEHNAFDNKDNFYAKTIPYDSLGNLSVTYFKYKDTLLVEYTEPDDYFEDYYTIPKSSRSEIIIEPYYYQYEGYPYIFYETSVVVPIFVDTAFVGVFGIDINMDALEYNLNHTKLYKSGYLSLITNSGFIVSHADTSFIKKNILQIIPESDTLTFNAITFGKELALETVSEFTGKKVFRYFYPISASGSSKPWSMLVEIPIEEATIRSKQLLYIAIGTLIVGLSLLIYLVFNIFDRKRYEKTILTAKFEAEESSRLKTAFLNNISHEIRTPLNGILGFTELLTESEVSDDQVKIYKDIIHNSSNQLLSIISNVLDLSKIQSGKIEKIVREFDVEAAISKVIDFYSPSAVEKGLKIVPNYPIAEEKTIINSDENKFKQILSYLINNAIKFTKTGSIEVGFYNQQDSILFYVMDTGIGIRAEDALNIFKNFNQADQSMTRNFGGLGIGLSISKSFIELLGGSIRFESEPGKGATFYFTLPNSQQKSSNSVNLNFNFPSDSKFTILIAEDEKHNYILLNEIIKNSGIKTLWASNGEEAVNLCKANKDIKIVFMDIKMPVMNGYEACKIIKSFNKDLPIVAVTANFQPQDGSQKITFDSIISKPYKKEDLWGVISTFIKSEN